MDPQWIEIETRLAFQDEHVLQLDRALARQQLEIDALRRDLGELLNIVRELAQTRGEGPAAEPPPPHY